MDMNIKDVSANEGIKIVSALDDIKDMRQVADQLDLRYSGNSGIKAIRTKIIAYLTEQETDEDEPMTDLPKIPEPETPPTELPNAVVGVPPEEPIQVAKIPKKKAKLDNNDLLSMDPKQVKDPVLRRLVVRAKALRLIRVQITNLDPADSALSGAIISVINKYTGKVSKPLVMEVKMDTTSRKCFWIISRIRSLLFEKKSRVANSVSNDTRPLWSTNSSSLNWTI